MISQVANQEALYSAEYVHNYLDCVENLPDDLQRHLSRMRELDVNFRACLRDVEHQYETWSSTNDPNVNISTNRRMRAQNRIQQSLIAAQEFGDEKLQVVQMLQDLIENKARQLDQDYKNLDYSKDEPHQEPHKEQVPITAPAVPASTPTHNSLIHNNNHNNASNLLTSGERASKRARRTRNDVVSTNDLGSSENLIIAEPSPVKAVVLQTTSVTAQKKGNAAVTGKKKKRKSRNNQQTNQRERDDTPPPEEPDPIDPDEPTYCLCDQISFGEMILCDNDLCPIEWFHFSCVSLTTKPKGRWYCPKCRGDRQNTMKPKAQFLKELERYNKEKEEKT